MNVLITAAGRRNYLVRYFKYALAGRGRVLAADISPGAPALQEADESFLLPGASDPQFVEQLLDLCRRQQVRGVLSVNDLELPTLAAHRDVLAAAGVVPIVSTLEVIDICFDKAKTVEFLESVGLTSPATFATMGAALDALDGGAVSLPLVVKPRHGTASFGIEVAHSRDELRMAFALTTAKMNRSSMSVEQAGVLIQEHIAGPEYGLDVINDLEGSHVATIIKRKLGMRGGETDSAVTVRNEELESIGRVIGENLGHVANLDCDVLVRDGQAYVLEANPRFGGGYPFSHVAGVDLPAAIVAWLAGETPPADYFTAQEGVAAAKADELYLLPPLEEYS